MKLEITRIDELNTEPVKQETTVPEGFYTIPLLQIPVLLMEAINVCNGVYGDGEKRIETLEKAGFNKKDIDIIQRVVNNICELWG